MAESKVINVGSRNSPLALAQTNIVVAALKAHFPEYEFPIHGMTTTGDRDQNTALYNFGGKALWTSQLEERLVSKELDFVVHSLKDMPTALPEGCVIGCITSREDPRDTLVIKKELVEKHGWKSLADLPAGSIIGTSSVRRIAQLVRRYPELKFKDHRGNIQTRLRKLEDDPDLTGIILAAAGLQRMDLGDHISQFLESDNGGILHAVGQGALGVECRSDDERMIAMLKTIENKETKFACEAERSLMRTLEGGCSVPIGVETKWVDGKLHMKATVVALRGDVGVDCEKTEEVTTHEGADEFGKQVAQELVNQGAGKPSPTMVTKSKLKMALAAEKGTDFKNFKLKRKQKDTARQERKTGRGAAEVNSSDEDDDDDAKEVEEVAEGDGEDDDDEEDEQIDLDAINDSDSSESSIELEEKIVRKPSKKNTPKKADVAEEDEEEEEDDEDIPMSDLEDLDDDDKEDLVPHQRLTINNTTALLASLKRIAIPTDKSVPFVTHQTVVASDETADSIPDVSDDLQRELAFYSQSLEAVRIGRSHLLSDNVPFSRPKDYFAEMVKEDAHMEKVKAKLVEEATNKKAAAEARKLRDLKKFGKQVQVAKLQERQKAKRETLEKIKTLKRKRQESGGGDIGTKEADMFDVGVESELKKHNQRSGAGRGHSAGAVNHKRQNKNEKYGFGGKKRHAKSGDAMSSGDLSGFNAKKMKAGGRSKVTKPTRPGKARRKAMGK